MNKSLDAAFVAEFSMIPLQMRLVTIINAPGSDETLSFLRTIWFWVACAPVLPGPIFAVVFVGHPLSLSFSRSLFEEEKKINVPRRAHRVRPTLYNIIICVMITHPRLRWFTIKRSGKNHRPRAELNLGHDITLFTIHFENNK